MSTETSYRKRQPKPVWRWMILFILITLLASFWLTKALTPLGNLAIAYFNTNEESFTGVITDTHCAGDSMAAPNAECIKRCVESNPSIKYALYDGHALYVLSDQQTPQRFLARKVRVRGTLHKDDRVLHVKAIDPA